MANGLEPSRLHGADALRTASVGLHTRKLRAALSALGIMIGIAALVGVLGLSESSKSDLLAQLDRLGTNLLTVQAGSGIGIGQFPQAFYLCDHQRVFCESANSTLMVTHQSANFGL